jgi:hypothetical protein
MRRAVVVVVVLVVAFAAPASATEVTIYPGVGIGKLKLGMTQAQVEKVLGKDDLVDERATVGGAAYHELGWNFASWSVGLLQGRVTWRVVQVATTVRSQRTLNRIGAGSTFKSVVRAFSQAICGVRYARPGVVAPPKIGLLVAQKGGLQTVFWVATNMRSGAGTWRVYETTVRQSFRPLGAFGPGHECRDGWRERGTP